MKYVYALMLLSLSAVAAADCLKYCNPEVSKPCGRGCISKAINCHIPWTVACSGIRPGGSSKPTYESPKKIDINDIPKAN